MKVLREFRVEDGDEAKVGDKVSVEIFKAGDTVDIMGTSKGKGFQGVVKRHHFRGGAATHGSMFHRAPGSIGASAFPSRVLKGMRAAGHMGADRVTQKNLTVVRVDGEKNILVVKGLDTRRTAAGTWSSGRRARGSWPRRRRRHEAKAAKPKRRGPQEEEGPRSRTRTRPTWAARPKEFARSAIDVVNTSNEKVSNIVLHPDVFRARVNKHLLYEAVKQYRAGGRARHARDQEPAPSSAARARSPGGRRAPAAPASARSARPLWRHGGTVFGPEPRDYSYDMPKKARAAALRSALSQRVQDGGAQGRRPLRHRGAEDEGAEGHPA